MVFFVPNPKKVLFAWIYYLKWQKGIGSVIRFVHRAVSGAGCVHYFFLIFPPNAGATKDGYFPQKEIKSLPYNSFFKSSMSGRALRSRSGISLDAR